jgi:hypothetical protein
MAPSRLANPGGVSVTRSAFLLTSFLVLCAFGNDSVSAQSDNKSQAQTTTSRSTSQTTPENDDLSITANVTARELRFDVVPNPKVEFPGSHERKTAWEAERQNLPQSVEPGVTYRNIGIRLKITSVFADIDRIVSEALGEVPITDEVPSGENISQDKSQTPPPPAAAPQPSVNSTTQRPKGSGPR